MELKFKQIFYKLNAEVTMFKFVNEATMDGIMKYGTKEKFKLEMKSAGKMNRGARL